MISIESIHPFFRTMLDGFAAMGRPNFSQTTPANARELLRLGQQAMPRPSDLSGLAAIDDEEIRGPHGGIRIRRYRPQGEIFGTCIFMHAGGWVIGDLDTADSVCRRLASASACEVVSVDYRLAPEHSFPAPLDDAYAVLRWAASRGRPLVVAGESAGGNLAAACAIRARDEDGPRIVAQFLACPVLDHDFRTPSYEAVGDRNWLLSTADMKWFWDQYCPGAPDRLSPLASPLRAASVAGLPPAFVVVAELDPLRDEGLAFAARLQNQGVATVVEEGKGMLHGYTFAAEFIPEVGRTVDEAARWLRERVAAAT